MKYFIKFVDREVNVLTIDLLDSKKNIRTACARLRDERDENGLSRWIPSEYKLPSEALLEAKDMTWKNVHKLACALQDEHAKDFIQWLIDEAYTENGIAAVRKYEETREKLWEDKKPITFTNLKKKCNLK